MKKKKARKEEFQSMGKKQCKKRRGGRVNAQVKKKFKEVPPKEPSQAKRRGCRGLVCH